MSVLARTMVKVPPEVGQVVEVLLEGLGWRAAEVILVKPHGFRVEPYRGFTLWLNFDEDVWRWPHAELAVEGVA